MAGNVVVLHPAMDFATRKDAAFARVSWILSSSTIANTGYCEHAREFFYSRDSSDDGHIHRVPLNKDGDNCDCGKA